MAALKQRKCRCCEGTGKEFDHKLVGEEMRRLRIKSGLSQAQVARRLGFSAPYVCDLEAGSRNWTDIKITLYRKACE